MKIAYISYDDGEDGRGTPRIIAAFDHHSDAEKAHHGYGHVQSIVVYKDAADYKENNPGALRERALAKLTAEEKKVLGLS